MIKVADWSTEWQVGAVELVRYVETGFVFAGTNLVWGTESVKQIVYLNQTM